MKKYSGKITALLMAAFIIFLAGNCAADSPAGEKNDYGVFIGLGPANLPKLCNYRTVIIDAAYFSSEDIAALHQNRVRVYSYLNIGAIEDFRLSDFPQIYDAGLAALALGDYAGWPGERWMDVSAAQWQDALINRAAPFLAAKEIDGFFLDNSDVYYFAGETDAVFQGLLRIIEGIGARGKPLILNGGDSFVSRALVGGKLPPRVKGINQESVFTSVDDNTKEFGVQDSNTKKYFQRYLQLCKDAKLTVYLTEYAAAKNGTLINEIKSYCEKNGFLFYIANSPALD
jgi:hypothetical protein